MTPGSIGVGAEGGQSETRNSVVWRKRRGRCNTPRGELGRYTKKDDDDEDDAVKK